MRIQFLGTSGHGITLERNLPAILIDNKILIDCGEGTLKTLKKLNIDIHSIKVIFLSHLHADHCMGLPAVLWEYAIYSRKDVNKPVSSPFIYVPEGMKKHLENILKDCYSPFEAVKFSLRIVELPSIPKKNLEIKLGSNNYHIDWIPNVHIPLSFAFRINHQLGISNDTAPTKKLTEFFSNLSMVIHEASFFDEQEKLAHQLNHSTPSDAANLGKNAHVSQVILTHLPNLTQKNKKMFLSNAKKIFPNILIAQDLDVFILS